MSNFFQTCFSPILIGICVSECRRKFSEKVACQRHMYKDWAPRKRPVEEHQLEFTCIAQKIYSRANFICRFCGCGEKDGGPFFSYHRTAQHSLGRTCTLKVFELQREEWYPGNLLEPTPENIEELCKESSAYDCLKQKYKSFYLKGESAVLKKKPKGNVPGEYSWSEKRRREGKGYSHRIKDLIKIKGTPKKKIEHPRWQARMDSRRRREQRRTSRRYRRVHIKPDSDSDEEALQEETCEEDESEEEVATHVRQGTIKSYRFTYINFSTYQFDYLPNDSTDTYRKYSKNIHKSSQ